MNRTRLVFLAIIAMGILLVWGVMKTHSPPPPGPERTEHRQQPAGSVLVSIASSTTKQKWMEQVARKFEDETTRSGDRIRIEVIPVTSGGSTKAILAGKLKPTVWSPGIDSWVAKLKRERKQRGNRPLMSKPCRPGIYTPLGFAIWRPMAKALGWPDKPVGWKTIVELASDAQGWARYGHPEWGKFRLGHAHPGYANSGLLSVTSFVYGMLGKTDNLVAAEVYDAEVEKALRILAQNTSKYGKKTEDLLDLMVRQGPRYLHAVATYESDAVRLNLEREDELRFPVAFVFPSEGAFWGDHPYCILDKAEWVSEKQAEAAEIFYNYMHSREQQELAVDSLLRPLDSSIPLRAPLDLAHGTNPEVKPETVPPLASPDADIAAAVIDLFLITKRKATILLVLDTSGSMRGKKIRTAANASAAFLRRLHANDIVGALSFDTTVRELSKLKRTGDVAESLADRVSTLVAAGNTALYSAVCRASSIMKKQQAADAAAGDNRLYGIVLLSDGADTVGTPSENQMFTMCMPAHAEADGVKIFPIAFGKGANKPLLKRLANVSGGQMFSADPDSIDKIYLRISAEQ
ncbi:MAG: VWA domain-containing protein [Gammaproteobacteria bacterium]|nr:VWA domain-containing protein [Gammaproteobacteria bacterium]